MRTVRFSLTTAAVIKLAGRFMLGVTVRMHSGLPVKSRKQNVIREDVHTAVTKTGKKMLYSNGFWNTAVATSCTQAIWRGNMMQKAENG